MPEPKASLARTLFERMGGKLPEVVGSAPVDTPGSAPSTLRGNPLGWALEHGMDVLRGVSGIGDQGPAGPTATNLGQVLGAAMPLVPGGSARSLLKGAVSEGLSPSNAARFLGHVPEGVTRRLEHFMADPKLKAGFEHISESPRVFATEGTLKTEPTLQFIDAAPHEKDLFVKQGNRIGAKDQIQQDALDTAYYEYGKAKAKNDAFRMPTTLEEIYNMANRDRTHRATQARLPLDGPLVSVHNSIPAKTAEDVVRTIGNTIDSAYPNGEASSLYNSLKKVNIDPSRVETGGFDPPTRELSVGVPDEQYYQLHPDSPRGQEINTAAHETQHVIDDVFNPEIYAGYEAPTLRSSNQKWIDYFTHPAEHKADTTGSLEHFLHNSREGKQATFGREFLRPLASHHAREVVQPTVDRLSMGLPMETIEQVLKDRAAAQAGDGSLQLALPLPLRGR